MERPSYRVMLPVVMAALALVTLRLADQELQSWVTQREQARQQIASGGDIESIPFFLPFKHNRVILDTIGFQWPAFLLAQSIAPTPQLFYPDRSPVAANRVSYFVLPAAVALYWWLIAVWFHRGIVRASAPARNKFVLLALKTALALTGLFFIVFLGKSLLGGWPEGPQGAHGITAWLALVSALLFRDIQGIGKKAEGAGLS